LYSQDNASLHERDRRNIEYEQVLEKIRVLLPSLNLNPKQDTQAILDEIVYRSGLLLPIDGGQRYQFSHLTLQEYFAAEALSNQEYELIERFKQDRATWRETVKLWCGLAGNKTSFIEEIFQHDSLTGFECLADAKEVDQTLADQIIDYYKQQLSQVIDDDDLAKAFGSVAADLRENSRGKLVFDFLTTALNNNSDVLNQKASAKALSFTNSPQAAKILAQGYKRKKEYCNNLSDYDQLDIHKNCLKNIREALVRMGDLAVPPLATLAELGNKELIRDLIRIATPYATKVLVDFLWHTNESLSFNAAWNLAELFNKVDVYEIFQEFNLTVEQQNAEYLDWIWQPFNNPSSSSLSVIAGRIVYLLDKTPTESIPNPLQKLDPRLIVPLLSLHNVLEFPSNNGWNSLADSLLEQQEQTPEIEEKITKQVNQILRIQSTRNRWRMILSSLKPRLQLNLLRRLITQRRPTYNDWQNLFLKVNYQFQRSYHYGLVLAMGLIASIAAIGEMCLLMNFEDDNWLNGFLGFGISIILIFWIFYLQEIKAKLESYIFLQLGILGVLTFGLEIRRLFRDYIVSVVILRACKLVYEEGAANVNNMFLVSFSFVGTLSINIMIFAAMIFHHDIDVALLHKNLGVAIFFAMLALCLLDIGTGTWYRAKSKTDWTRFLAIFALPYFCWFPIVVVFSTLFMLRYLTWQYTALTWLIVLGTCTALWLYGQDKHRKASNPLRGILDVAK
ncbi:MAG: NACHT domain-containing NTPase, partial [Xenococcus sp. (in: cyanobacteria)]